jgi:hypothetical protein
MLASRVIGVDFTKAVLSPSVSRFASAEQICLGWQMAARYPPTAHYQATKWRPKMPRSRQRVCLQDGLKLDLNWLARNGFVQFGANTGFREIRWTHSYWGKIANGLIMKAKSETARIAAIRELLDRGYGRP